MKILIDNGHGVDTKGKRSPKWADGSQLLEYAYAREIAGRVSKTLRAEGYDVKLITPERNDIDLNVRCRRVNAICREVGAKNCLLVSIHNNAMGNGEPEKARGWSVFVGLNASVASKRLADCFCDSAINCGLTLRKYSPQQRWWRGNLAICRDTLCAAVLTENLFMDNAEDCKYLLSEQGKATIARIHAEAIKKYING